MNKFIGVGNLTSDPQIRYSQTGTAVANFSIAINGAYGGNKTVDYIPIVAFKNLAEIVGNNLSKGRKILVEGRMQVRNYEGKDGIKRYVTEIVAQNIEFMDGKKQPNNNDPTGMGTEVYPEEEVPF